MTLALIAVLGLFAAAQTPAAAVASDEPPVPSAAPVLHPAVDAERYAAAIARAKWREATMDQDPRRGLEVASVEAGTAADRAGVVVGEVAVEADGQQLAGDDDRTLIGAHRLKLWNDRTGSRVVDLGDDATPSRLVLAALPRSDAAALRAWSREPGVWSDDLLLAVLDRHEDPEIAEAALAHAAAAGYHGHLLRTLAAVILADEARYDDALAAGLAMRSAAAADERGELDAALRSSAIATGRVQAIAGVPEPRQFDPALKSTTGHPHAPGRPLDFLPFVDDLSERGLPSATMDWAWLLEAPVFDLTTSIAEFGPPADPESCAALGRHEPLWYRVANGHGSGLSFGPTCADAELDIDVACSVTDGGSAADPIDFVDVSLGQATESDRSQDILGVILRCDGTLKVRRRNGSEPLALRRPVQPGRETHEVRLVVRDDRCAAFVDHRCVYVGRCPIARGERRLVARLFHSGMTTRDSGVSWLALDGRGGSRPPSDPRRADLLRDTGDQAAADSVHRGALRRDAASARAAALWFWDRRDFATAQTAAEAACGFAPGDDNELLLALLRIADRTKRPDLAAVERHREALGDWTWSFALGLFLRQRGCEAEALPIVAPLGDRSLDWGLMRAWAETDTGAFAAAQAHVRTLLGTERFAKRFRFQLYPLDIVLSRLAGVEPADPGPLEEWGRDPAVEPIDRLCTTWMRGLIDDGAAAARAARLPDGNRLFWLRGLRDLADGRIADAHADLRQTVALGPVAVVAGAARTLDAWIDRQDDASLKKLVHTAAKPHGAADDF